MWHLVNVISTLLVGEGLLVLLRLITTVILAEVDLLDLLHFFVIAPLAALLLLGGTRCPTLAVDSVHVQRGKCVTSGAHCSILSSIGSILSRPRV